MNFLRTAKNAKSLANCAGFLAFVVACQPTKNRLHNATKNADEDTAHVMHSPINITSLPKGIAPDLGVAKATYQSDGGTSRSEVFELCGSDAEKARSVALIVDRAELISLQNGPYTHQARTFGETAQLCAGTKFEEQYSLGNCSAFLVGVDLMMTTCGGEIACSDRQNPKNNAAFVFDFNLKHSSLGIGVGQNIFRGPRVFLEQNVYRCKEVLPSRLANSTIRLIRLDRPVCGRTPFSLERANPVVVDDNSKVRLTSMSHPFGLPLKTTTNSAVTSRQNSSLFYSPISQLPGSAGGPVFDQDTGKVVGVLGLGALTRDPSLSSDFETIPNEACKVEKRCLANCKGTPVSDVVPFVIANNVPELPPSFKPAACPAVGSAAVVNSANSKTDVSWGGIGTVYYGAPWPEATSLKTVNLKSEVSSLPTTMSNIKVNIDTKDVGLFFVGPSQINFAMPTNARPYSAEPVPMKVSIVHTLSGQIVDTTIQMRDIAPALFSADASGKGAPAGFWLYRENDYRPLAKPNGEATQIPVEEDGKPVYVVVFGTGLAGFSKTGAPRPVVKLGGQAIDVAYVGASPGAIGLDQVNFLLPKSFAGAGLVDLSIEAAGHPEIASNILKIAIK